MTTSITSRHTEHLHKHKSCQELHPVLLCSLVGQRSASGEHMYNGNSLSSYAQALLTSSCRWFLAPGQPALFISSSLYFLVCSSSNKIPRFIPFLISCFSSKHPIISPTQTQCAYPLHSITSHISSQQTPAMLHFDRIPSQSIVLRTLQDSPGKGCRKASPFNCI